jgi:hypothetical protein
MPASDERERDTRDLVISLSADVRHLSEQIKQVLKMEERVIAAEKTALEAKDFAARLTWLVGGLSAGVLALILAIVPRLLK